MPPRRKRLLETTGSDNSEYGGSDARPTKRSTRKAQSLARYSPDSAEDSEAATEYQDTTRNAGSDNAQPAASTVARQVMETQRTILQELEEECGKEGREDASVGGGGGIAGDAPDVYSCIMESGGGSKKDQKLFKATESLFRTCKSTLANYRSVKDDTNRHEQPDGDEQPPEDASQLLDSSEVKWLEDTQNLDQIVDFAHIWARHIAVCMVTGERPRGPGAEDLDERGDMAIDSFQKSGDMACGNGSWGKARKVQVKALRMLATASETQEG